MMSDDMLSQEEIEALLRGTLIEDNEVNAESEKINVDDYLDSFTQGTLGEIGNISFGSSATALSTLLGQKVDITTPSIDMINSNKLDRRISSPLCCSSS